MAAAWLLALMALGWWLGYAVTKRVRQRGHHEEKG